MKSLKTIDLVYMAVGAVLITVCSWISIPFAVPFTLQTFAVFFVIGLLGGKRATISILVYLILGAVGVPVFSGFRGGAAALIGPTGGYILGFLLMALIYWGAEKLNFRKCAGRGTDAEKVDANIPKREKLNCSESSGSSDEPAESAAGRSGITKRKQRMKFLHRIIVCSIGLLVCYAFGTAWFMVVYTGQTGAIGLGTALMWCVVPFIIPDIAKMVLAIVLSERLRKLLHI
ncbi:MAG: biotin transporter BioY [Parasporobacterium sp.]|nr:biotin transporter BioY [Parasporobacterium sp.]